MINNEEFENLRQFAYTLGVVLLKGEEDTSGITESFSMPQDSREAILSNIHLCHKQRIKYLIVYNQNDWFKNKIQVLRSKRLNNL